MVSGKYGKYIKTVPFSPFLTEEERLKREAQLRAHNDPRADRLRQVARRRGLPLNMRGDMDFGGVDMTFRLFKINEAPFTIEEEGFVHNFHQYLVFVSSDPYDPYNLGGEAEMSFGEEGHKYLIDKTTVIHVPPGIIHCPLVFTKLDRPMLMLELFTSYKYLRTAVYDIAGRPAPRTTTTPAKYAKHIKAAPFFTKKEIRDTQGKYSPMARVRGISDLGGVDLCMEMSYINKPHVLEDDTHTHNFHQYLVFLGSDLDNPDDLDGQVTMCFGDEKEKYTINKPAIVHVAPGLVHSPIEFTKIGRPLLYIAMNTTPYYTTMGDYEEGKLLLDKKKE